MSHRGIFTRRLLAPATLLLSLSLAPALHAVRVLAADGRIRPSDAVVVFNTGGALKYL